MTSYASPVASEKLKGPLIFLGILLHASVQQLCLPPDKLEELTGLTRSWYFQAQSHQEGTALAHQQAPLCFKGGANREVLPLLPDQPVHHCQEAPPPHQQALTLRQELMLCGGSVFFLPGPGMVLQLYLEPD